MAVSVTSTSHVAASVISTVHVTCEGTLERPSKVTSSRPAGAPRLLKRSVFSGSDMQSSIAKTVGTSPPTTR